MIKSTLEETKPLMMERSLQTLQSIFHFKFNLSAVRGDQLLQLILESLGGGIQGSMLHLLADADCVGAAAVCVPLPFSSGAVESAFPQAVKLSAIMPASTVANTFFFIV